MSRVPAWYTIFNMFLEFFLGALALLAGGAYVTHPFVKLSIVRRPFIAKLIKGSIVAVDQNKRLKIKQGLLWRAFAYLKCGIYILTTRYVHSPRASSKTIDGIVSDIHRLRFDPKKLLLVSGDHFSALFVRNLGVFYYPMLDRTTLSANETDWQDRQVTYLQTLAYALGVFNKQKTLTTTIVPAGRYSATCINFYAYPSDTLYGMLYALAALLGKEKAVSWKAKSHHELDTIPAATLLFEEYKESLVRHYETYRTTVFDETTGLISCEIHMSGAKDITRRTSAFYDNVIFWKTTELAMTMKLIPFDRTFLRTLKQRIIDTFWLEEEGYFLEDLSTEGLEKKYYSSDWLIVLATGFLSPEKAAEQRYFERSIAYIQKEKIDQPFAIKYQQSSRAHRQFLAVRLAVASYGGDSIWSFWGMEYIKVLLLLHKTTGNIDRLKAADYHIKKYEENMLRDEGFPEVYNPKGKLLQTPFYRSIRQTGWVIGFEQVRELRKSIEV